MKVLPISIGYKYNHLISEGKNKPDFTNYYQRNKLFVNSYNTNYKTIQNINFSGNNFICKVNDLKDLAKNSHLGCIWCGGSMFTQGELDAFTHFSKRLAANSELFSRVMMHFKDYFPKERIALIKEISNYSKAYPNKDLKFIINKMSKQSEKRLIIKQLLIFHKIKKLKNKLPENTSTKIDSLLKHSKFRIFGIPYVSEYSGKEFYYQLTNITKNIPPKPKKEIMELANFLNNPIFKESPTEIPKDFLKRIYKNSKINPNSKNNYISPNDNNGKDKTKLLILNKILQIAEENKFNDIINLCNTTKNKILGIPVAIKFSNKAFCYKLHEILANTEDKNLIQEFDKITKQLPNSLTSKDAFIIKNKNCNEAKIINKLLDDSKVTLEHIKPILRKTTNEQLKEINAELSTKNKIKKGENNIGNWALAHNWCNKIHGSQNIKNENFPFSKEAGQKYFETLIIDANNGLIAKESIIKMAKNYFEETEIDINLENLL